MFCPDSLSTPKTLTVELCISLGLQELLQARLADAAKQNEESQERQHARLKEVARRWAGGGGSCLPQHCRRHRAG